MPTLEDRQAPEARAAERAPLSTPIGVSGLKQFSGYVREDFLPYLSGDRGRQVFEEMSKNDSTCAAVLFGIKNLLRGMEWRVTPSDPNSARAIEMAELLEGMLFFDMEHTWPEFIEAACSQFVYGFAVHEILWKKRKGLNVAKPWLSSDYDDGYWAPRAFAPRSQKTILRWIYDDEGNLLGAEQSPWDRPAIVLPIRRCLHFRTTAELDSPEGQSLLRPAYRSWYWLKRMQEIEGIGTERDLAGYPVLKVPGDMLSPTADPQQIAARGAYEEFLRKVRRDQNEGVLIPSDRDDNGNPHYEFSLLSAGGSRQLQIDASITRYQKDIARSVLADFIFLGADGGGSLALGRTKVQFFAEALKAYARQITAQINEIAVSQIWRMNGLDMEICPSVEPGEIEAPDLAALGSYLTALSGIGFDLASDTELENHVRQIADLPDAPDRTEDDDFTAMPSGRAVKLPLAGYDEDGNPIIAGPETVGGGEEKKPGEGPPKPGAKPDHGKPGVADDEDDQEAALGKAMRAAWGAGPDPLARLLEGFDHG